MKHLSPQIKKGLWLGLLGVVIFALTLPLTRLAVGTPQAPQLSGLFVSTGRATVAALLSMAFLWATRAPWPARANLAALGVVMLGVVFGFPMLSSIAMRHVEATHASVMLGVLPLATAGVGAWLHRQRPSAGFWVCAGLGTALVVAFAVLRSGHSGFALAWADTLLLAAMACAAGGYGMGSLLSQRMRAEHVICWALILGLPLNLPLGPYGVSPVSYSFQCMVRFCVCGGVFPMAGLFCLVPRPGPGRHGARQPRCSCCNRF
jgi:drug/metabolite transporter (DMT)-like permease